MLSMVINGHFSKNTAKQQTVPNGAPAVLSPLVITDSVKVPENIFLQALSTNVESIIVGFSSGVVAGGAGIELPAGANVNLPSNRYKEVYVVCASGGQKLNIVYSEGLE